MDLVTFAGALVSVVATGIVWICTSWSLPYIQSILPFEQPAPAQPAPSSPPPPAGPAVGPPPAPPPPAVGPSPRSAESLSALWSGVWLHTGGALLDLLLLPFALVICVTFYRLAHVNRKLALLSSAQPTKTRLLILVHSHHFYRGSSTSTARTTSLTHSFCRRSL